MNSLRFDSLGQALCIGVTFGLISVIFALVRYLAAKGTEKAKTTINQAFIGASAEEREQRAREEQQRQAEAEFLSARGLDGNKLLKKKAKRQRRKPPQRPMS